MATKRFFTAVVGAALIALGCGSEPVGKSADETGAGRIQLALRSTVGSTTYVLANASFGVERIQPPPQPGDISALRLHQTDPTAGDLTAMVAVGTYAVTLIDGWRLEREDSPTVLVPLEAVLLTTNPVMVSVFNGQTSTVTFQFQTNGLPIAIGPGSGTIDIGVGVATCDPAAPSDFALNIVADPGFEGDLTAIAREWSSTSASGGLSNTSHCGLHSIDLTSGAMFHALPAGQTAGQLGVSAWFRRDTTSNVTIAIGDPTGSGCESTGQSFSIPAGLWTHISAALSMPAPCSNPLAFAISGADAPVLIDDVYLVPR